MCGLQPLHSRGSYWKASNGCGPSVAEVRVVVTRPPRALQPAVIATSIISEMKAIKIGRIHSGHQHLAPVDEYGAVMDLQGCHDCFGSYKAEVMP